MLLDLFILILGMGILIFGAEGLVRGASSIAHKWGISRIVIGLTIVSFGTSAPELLVNILAAMNGSTELAIGNVIGSNTANILLILGITAMMYPLSVKQNTAYKEIPFALLAVVMVFLMGNDALFEGADASVLSRTDGFAFLSLFIIFLYYTYGISKVTGEKEDVVSYGWGQSIALLIVGIVALAFGGDMIVDSAMSLAATMGISERIIGLTIVAIGTSLPELATSIVAALRKHADIAIGNAVGSNIFNIFWILGITSIIKPIPFNTGINIDVLVTAIATILLFTFIVSGKKKELTQWQGLLFLLFYISYLLFITFAPFCLPAYCPA